MAGRNRTVMARIPAELHFVFSMYQNQYRLNQTDALRRIMETHPALVELATALYDVRNEATTPRT